MMRVLPLFFALTLLPGTSVHAESEPPDLSSLAEMSIDELADLEITSLGKKATRLSQAPASLYVVTSSDIRRSGATTLPEALRLAPNLQVARVDSNQYAISARGLNGTVANKLQVLIDGRIVYTPLFSGVLWSIQDVMLEDVERIEVISGPEDASWGANSVNGVINIITRNSKDTQGTLVSTRASGEEQHAAARYGAEIAPDSFLRLHAKASKVNDFGVRTGGGNNDEWERRQGGFRLDRETGGQSLRLQGNLTDMAVNEDGASPTDYRNSFLQAEWQKQDQSGAQVRLMSYLDHQTLDSNSTAATLQEELTTFYVEFQHNLATTGRHSLLWGVDYRRAFDRIDDAVTITITPADADLEWISIFGSDRIRLTDNLELTISARAERNDYSGTEYMPSARLAYNVNEDHLLWAAASHAVRTPSRIDKDFYFSITTPFPAQVLSGGPNFDSETADVFQLGYRAFFTSLGSLNITAYRAEYDGLRGIEVLPDTSLGIANVAEGAINGLESWGNLQLNENWRLSLGATWMDRDLKVRRSYRDLSGSPFAALLGSSSQTEAEGNDPTHQFTLRSDYNIGKDKELDINARHVGALSNSTVDSYTAIDARFAWWVDPKLELSVTGNNLFDSEHVEFSSANGVEVQRSVSLGVRWDF